MPLLCGEEPLPFPVSSLLSQGCATSKQMGCARHSWLFPLCALGSRGTNSPGRTSRFLLFESRWFPLYLWPFGSPRRLRHLWLMPPGVGRPLTPSGNGRAGEIARSLVFFPSLCFLTLITFCCGKEMRWGLKTDHCPPLRLMQRKRYCPLNG